MTNLPPLPRAGIKAIGVDEKPLTVYRADQMLEYGALCRKMALEEAVKACDDIDDRCHDCLGQNEHAFCTGPVKEDYVEAIKGLLK